MHGVSNRPEKKNQAIRTYDIQIEERLVRHVQKEARSAEEAEQAVSDEWHDGKLILAADDFQEVSFAAVPVDHGGREVDSQ